MHKNKVFTAGIVVLLIILLASVLLVSCAAPQSTSTTAAPQQVLKIGEVEHLGLANGVAAQKVTKVYAAMFNDKGGLDVGGTRYKLEMIQYNGEGDQTKASSAVNRLIFEDKVKYIIGMDSPDAWVPLADKEGVLTSVMAPTPAILDPNFKYAFQTGFIQTSMDIVNGWYVSQHPEYKTYCIVLDDSFIGKLVSNMTAQKLKRLGVQVTQEFYPAGQQDLSAVATKVKALKPDVVYPYEMAPVRAIRDAGYQGALFTGITLDAQSAVTLAGGAQYVEGLVMSGSPVEYDPPLTEAGVEFKEAYTKVFGKWETLEMTGGALLTAITTAMQQSGSIEVDKVAQVMASGMKWESAMGSHMMINRPDVGIERTVDSITTFYIKEIRNGKAVLIETIPPEEALELFRKATADKPAAPTTPAVPPPPAGAVVKWSDALNLTNFGDKVTVSGVVLDVVSFMPPATIVFIGDEGGDPMASFPLDIQDPKPFGDLAAKYKDKTVEVTAPLAKNNFTGKAQLTVTDPAQIVVK